MVLGLGVAAASLEKLYQMQILGASAGPPESEPVRAPQFVLTADFTYEETMVGKVK